MKLYGTLACKGDDIAERPHRRSAIISTPEKLAVGSVALLLKLLYRVRLSWSNNGNPNRADRIVASSTI